MHSVAQQGSLEVHSALDLQQPVMLVCWQIPNSHQSSVQGSPSSQLGGQGGYEMVLEHALLQYVHG
ncbi:MAG TPA: hypothetical protein DEB30_02635 [Candidatus Peribacter riflensis]|nr:MAG: hypothetical protein A2398_03030 [Candidatus Peribacteria bacterium RIFOXYB1_FULL_57_12]HBH20387.1 hypothetical protein [Candidatus Peribacter riflensis]HBU09674.1 hypothetical protein [Candidatus Peribacter riflensis]